MRDGKVDGSTSGFLLSQEHFGSISVITPNPKKLKGGGGQVAYLQGHGPRVWMTPGDGGVEGLWAYNGISGFLVQTEKCLDGRRRARLRRSAAIVGGSLEFLSFFIFLSLIVRRCRPFGLCSRCGAVGLLVLVFLADSFC
jgi:hypothetical protein